MELIRILMVDDHPLFLQGLHRILSEEPDFRIIGEASNGAEAVRQAALLQPDVLLMDINLPVQNGLEATRSIKQSKHGDDVSIIILTAYHDDDQIFYALQAGAAAYFPKDVAPSELIRAVRVVQQNQYMIGNQVMDHAECMRWLLHHFEGLDPSQGFHQPLSPREMQILHRIAQGASNKVIAHALRISEQTVKNHTSSLFRKLNVSDRTQLAVLALRRGWVRLDDTLPDQPLYSTDAGP